MKHIAGRAPVMAGDFHSNTTQAVAQLVHIRRWAPPQPVDSLPTSCARLRMASWGTSRMLPRSRDLPVIVYNNPGRTGLDLTPLSCVTFTTSWSRRAERLHRGPGDDGRKGGGCAETSASSTATTTCSLSLS